MSTDQFTCPRCLRSITLAREATFCPHCGLANVRAAATDATPLDLTIAHCTYRVLDRIAVGSICNIFRCQFAVSGRKVEGALKIARDARSNDKVLNEAIALRRLHNADGEGRFGLFVPAIEDSFAFDSGGELPRQANVLRMDDELRSLDELYTLAQVRSAYPGGLDPRDMAWIWRRLLSILGFAHSQGVIHGAVLPSHVLIEPTAHKLLLVDWCCAARFPEHGDRPITIITHGHLSWYRRQGAIRQVPAPSLDIAFGARCMIGLLGGDPLEAEFPIGIDPALQRYFLRCLGNNAGHGPGAWKLLDDFDRLIEALWGARKFRILSIPPKQKA